MDRVHQLRGGESGSAAGSPVSSIDDSLASPLSSRDASLAFVSACSDDTNYFSLSEADSTLDTPSQEHSANPSDSPPTPTLHERETDLDSFKLGQTIEAANILSGGVNIFEENENSFDGNELVIDDNVGIDVDKKLDDVEERCEVPIPDPGLVDTESDIPSKDTEVQLHIDGKSVDAIDIGNGLYLYRKEGEEELAAVQVFTEGEEPSFKFLKVRENAERNLEVYEEIEVEVTKSVPSKATKALKNTSSQGKQMSKPTGVSNEKKINQDAPHTNEKETVTLPLAVIANDPPAAVPTDSLPPKLATEPLEAKLSPIRSGFLPMAYHSTPNKDGIPLTKTMVDQQLHPSRHSDNVKKTIEVNTENCKQKLNEKGKIAKTDRITEDDKASSEPELNNIQSQPQCASHTKSACEVTSSTSKDENINKGNDYESVSDDKNTKQQSSQPTSHHLLIEELVQDSKMDETKQSNTKDTSVMTEKDNLAPKGKLEVTIKDKPTLITVEDTKAKEIEAVVTSPNSIPVQEKIPDIEVTDVFKLQPSVDTSQVKNTEMQQTKITDAHIKTTQDVSMSIKTSMSDDDKGKVPSNTKQNDDTHYKTITSNVLDVPLQQSSVPTSKVTITEFHMPQITVPSAQTAQGAVQAEPITSKEESHLNILDVKVSQDSKNYNMTTTTEPEENKVTEQLTSTENKLTLQKGIDKSNGNMSEQIAPVPNPLKNTHNNLRSMNTDSNKLSAPNIISEVNLIHEKLDNISMVKNDANNGSDELIQLTDLGLEVPTTALSEKGFPDCLKSVADLLKPKSYDGKKDLPISQIDIKKESKIDLAPMITKISAKPNTCTSKSGASEPISANVMPITKVESLSSVHDKPKSLLPVFTNKTGDALVTKYVNRAVIIKNHTVSGNIQIAPIINNSQATIKDMESGTTSDMKPKLLNNNSAVPFGKWTEANKQAYLTKINEPKVISNPNQIKQAKDLNRRDILKKMDSQRQSFVNYSRSLEVLRKANVKKEQTVYAVNVVPKQETHTGLKVENWKANINDKAAVPLVSPKATKIHVDDKTNNSSEIAETSKNRQDFNNQDLIDKTIEDLMDNTSGNITKPRKQSVDEVESKMNALHGIPFVERPMHELPSRYSRDLITYAKPSKRSSNSQVIKGPNVPKLQPVGKPLDTLVNKTINLDEDSEDEVFEHEPVTGDMQYSKSNTSVEKVSTRELLTSPSSSNNKKPSHIMEKEMNKFARTSSVAYDDSIKDKRDSKPLQIANNTVLQNEKGIGKYIAQASKSQFSLSSMPMKTPNFHPISTEESVNKTSPSKVQMAYTSAMSSKQYKKVSPITVIEDRAVKVMFMDQGSSYFSSTLNVQGNESTMKIFTKSEEYPNMSCVSDLASVSATKPDEQMKHPIKHQRKQVLTPVEEPALEVVSASGPVAADSNVTDKFKSTTDENHSSTEKSVMPKKTYLLSRSAFCADLSNDAGTSKNVLPISNAASAIDNLVKAAEMLENQQETAKSVGSSSESSQPVKRGRGRPRKYPLDTYGAEKLSTPSPQKKPRVTQTKRISTSEENETSSDDEMVMVNWTMGKINEDIVCPICGKLFRSENVVFKHVKHCTGPSPNRSETSGRRRSKRGRKRSGASDTSIDTLEEKSAITSTTERNSIAERVVKERKSSAERFAKDRNTNAERVAKERKTSPERVAKESNTSPERFAKEGKSRADRVSKQRKSRAESPNGERKISIEKEKAKPEQNDIIVIKDTPIKSNKQDEPVIEKKGPVKEKVISKLADTSKFTTNYGNIECAQCKKVFRQMSYYVKHKREECKSQHKMDLAKSKHSQNELQTVLSCEVCKKVFRKLHHLVQHRIIHEPTSSRRRKSSLELDKAKEVKSTEDQSAGFRCEACDKSFRKLHHLVEHRETHDVQSKNKTSPPVPSQPAGNQPDSTLQCDVCHKTFRKLHLMIEHKQQHANTKPDQTGEKNSKAAIATKDIIHECRLCYMVFPNEHSLNRHVGNCQKKKRQSVSKTGQAVLDNESVSASVDDSTSETTTSKPIGLVDSNTTTTIKQAPNMEKHLVNVNMDLRKESLQTKVMSTDVVKKQTTDEEHSHSLKSPIVNEQTQLAPLESKTLRRQSKEPSNKTNLVKTKKPESADTMVTKNTPNKKTPSKHNAPVTITRRQSSITTAVENKETSDDEDVRYMLNPDFEKKQVEAHDAFMASASHKRNSLQIDRPETKLGEVPQRRTSLQIHSKLLKRNHAHVQPKQQTLFKFPKLKSGTVKMNTSDSDDSDTKYAFPEVDVKTEPKTEDITKKVIKRRSINEKRKSLSGLAKKKIGDTKFKSSASAPPLKAAIKRRTLHLSEHKCDCGQIFTSATLLSHHVTLSHTPPRRSRRRSFTPTPPTQPINAKDTTSKAKIIPKQLVKSAVTRKSAVNEGTASKRQKKMNEQISSVDTPAKSTRKRRKSGFHSGVPVPAKMKHLFNKQKQDKALL